MTIDLQQKINIIFHHPQIQLFLRWEKVQIPQLARKENQKLLFDKYSSESQFRTEFVRPLLTKMGLLSITELDGPQEFGKDFVFSELTPFGFLRHYAVVVKHQRTIKQTNHGLCTNVLNQIRQAFSVSFRLPDSAEESNVSSVLVLNSGAITPGTTTWLRAELDRERYGRNIHIFDGQRLHQLDVQTTYQHRELLIPRLLGLDAHIKLNQLVLKSIIESLPIFSEGRGLFFQAIEDYISAPFFTTYLDFQSIATLLQEYRIISTINNRHINQFISAPEKTINHDIATLRILIKNTDERSEKIIASISQCLVNFQEFNKRLDNQIFRLQPPE